MNLDLGLINIIISFGAVQGLIFMVLAFTNRRHPGAFYLGLVMISLVYNGLETFNWSSGLEDHILLFDLYPFVTIFLIGPAFYLYYKALYSTESRIPKLKKAFYFGPFFFQFVFLTVGWIATLLTLLGHVDMRVPLDWAMGIYMAYSEPLSLVVFLLFTGLSVKDYFTDLKEINPDKRSANRIREVRSWVGRLLVFQVILGVIWTATLLVRYFLEWPFAWSYYYPVEIYLVIFLYWIAIEGYSKLRTIQAPDEGAKSIVPLSNSDESDGVLHRISKAMEENRLFLNPDLSLSALAQHTGISPKTISYTLNQLAGSNFNDFVNSFRVEAFCQEIQKEENSKLTLIGLASHCGFNSPATFQRTFKKIKGVTPKVYANSVKIKEKQKETTQIRI